MTKIPDGHDDDQPFYWSLDLPGMTSDQASQVVAVIESGGVDLNAVPVDPAVFLTLHMDRDTVEALVAGLAEARPSRVVENMKEAFVEWLEWLDESER